MSTKAVDPEQQKYFDYLDKLRESGKTNMFGAAPYLQRDFLLEKNEARDVLLKWMEAFEG